MEDDKWSYVHFKLTDMLVSSNCANVTEMSDGNETRLWYGARRVFETFSDVRKVHDSVSNGMSRRFLAVFTGRNSKQRNIHRTVQIERQKRYHKTRKEGRKHL